MEIFFRKVVFCLFIFIYSSCNFQNNQAHNWYLPMTEKSINLKNIVLKDFPGIYSPLDLKCNIVPYFDNEENLYKSLLFLASEQSNNVFYLYNFDENLTLLNRKASTSSFYNTLTPWSISLLSKKENSYMFFYQNVILFTSNGKSSIFDDKKAAFDNFYKKGEDSNLDSILYPYSRQLDFTLPEQNSFGNFINSNDSSFYSYKLYPSSTYSDINKDENFYNTYFTILKYIEKADSTKYEKKFELENKLVVDHNLLDKYKIFSGVDDFAPYGSNLGFNNESFRQNRVFKFYEDYNNPINAILVVATSVIKKVSFPIDVKSNKKRTTRFFEDTIITVFKIPYSLLSTFTDSTTTDYKATLSTLDGVQKLNYMVVDQNFCEDEEIIKKGSNKMFGTDVILTKIAPFKWTSNGLIVLIETCDSNFNYKTFYGLLRINEDFTSIDLDENLVLFNELSYTQEQMNKFNLDIYSPFCYGPKFPSRNFSVMKQDRLQLNSTDTAYSFNNKIVEKDKDGNILFEISANDNYGKEWRENLGLSGSSAGFFNVMIYLDFDFSIDGKNFYLYDYKNMRLVKGVTGW